MAEGQAYLIMKILLLIILKNLVFNKQKKPVKKQEL